MTGALFLESAGATLRWTDVRPERPDTVLVLPGLILPAGDTFDAVVGHSALADRRFLLVDYLGAGRSDHAADKAYSMARHARTMADLLDHLGTGPVDVLGYSMGGNVGLELALARPELVRHLLAAEANMDAGGGGLSARIAGQTLEAFRSEGFARLVGKIASRPEVARLAEATSKSDPVRLWQNARELVNLRPGVQRDFLTLPIPRTFVYGGRNTGKITPDTPDPAVLEAAGVGIAVVPDAGHTMMLDNPSAFAEIVAATICRAATTGLDDLSTTS